MDILPLLTLLLQAKGGAGAPPQGEAALARLVSALNAPARGEQAAPQERSARQAAPQGRGAPADTDALARLLSLLQAEAPPAQFAPPPASPDPPARAETTSKPATGGVWADAQTESASKSATVDAWAAAQAAARARESEEALAPVRRIADEEILRLFAAALSALNSDL